MKTEKPISDVANLLKTAGNLLEQAPGLASGLAKMFSATDVAGRTSSKQVGTDDDFRLFINGVRVEGSNRAIITVAGDSVFVNSLKVPISFDDDSRIVTVKVETGIADLHVYSGDVACNNVNGDVTAGGNVNAGGNINGDVSAQGNVKAHKVNGDVSANGNVKADRIDGDVIAAGSAPRS